VGNSIKCLYQGHSDALPYREYTIVECVPFWLGTVLKRCPQSGGRGLFSAYILRTRGVLQMRTSALLGAKNFGFFKMYCVSARVEPMRTFFGLGGRGQIFAIFCGCSLWTDLKINKNLLLN